MMRSLGREFIGFSFEGTCNQCLPRRRKTQNTRSNHQQQQKSKDAKMGARLSLFSSREVDVRKHCAAKVQVSDNQGRSLWAKEESQRRNELPVTGGIQDNT